MPYSRALSTRAGPCAAFGIGTASFSSSSSTVATRGRVRELRKRPAAPQNGALPATAESIIDSMRSVFARI